VKSTDVLKSAIRFVDNKVGRWARTTTIPTVVSSSSSVEECSLRFRCNICSTWCSVPVDQLGREVASCSGCGSTARLRSVARCLSLAFTGQSLPLADFPHELRGIGLSDDLRMAIHLRRHLEYENTYYHQEPLVDITSPPQSRLASVDFVLSSDVFEHVLSPVQRAFDGAFSLLRPGGWFILTVPFAPRELGASTVEHFPDLVEWRIDKTGPAPVLINITASGEEQRFENLVYHGGAGETLEMRLFSETDLVKNLTAAGFTEIRVADESDLTCGISWGNQRASVPIMARRPV
jgi:SAM-dependent methyltransferase